MAERLKLRYFAALREALGRAEEDLELPPNVQTPAQLRAHLARQGEPYAQALDAERPLRVAIDQRLAAPEDSLQGAREVAFFPPVTGG